MDKQPNLNKLLTNEELSSSAAGSSTFSDLERFVDIEQFRQLFYTNDQKYIGYGIVWYFITQQVFYTSDYSYQDLLNIERTRPGFIHSWILHAINKILSNRAYYRSSELSCTFIDFIIKTCRGISPVLHPETLAASFFCANH